MARFKVGRISRPGMGNWWYVEGITYEDEKHPFAQQQLFDGDLAFDDFLGVAWKRFKVPERDIVYIS
jgi:hypothetical protein